MDMIKLNLLVIRSARFHELKEQYEQLGLAFDYHKHGNGVFSLFNQCGRDCF